MRRPSVRCLARGLEGASPCFGILNGAIPKLKLSLGFWKTSELGASELKLRVRIPTGGETRLEESNSEAEAAFGGFMASPTRS